MADRYRKTPRYQCLICGTPVYLLSTKKHKLFFQHMPTASVCALKEKGQSSRDAIRSFIYGKRTESQKHRDLISAIVESLRHDNAFSGIEVEPTVADSQDPKLRRYPDVLVTFNERKIVIEAQVSSTFLDVIDARRNFYTKNEMGLIWVFPSFNEADRRIAEDDMIVQNGGKAIVVDQMSLADSQSKEKFMVRIHRYNTSSQAWLSEIKLFSDVINNTVGVSREHLNTEKERQLNNLRDLCSDLAGLFPETDKAQLASLSAYIKSQGVKFPTNRIFEDNWYSSGFEDFGIERHLRRMVQVIETAVSGEPFGYSFKQKPFLQIANSLLESDPFALTVYGSVLKLNGHQHALDELDSSPNWQNKVGDIRNRWKTFQYQSKLSDFDRDMLKLFYPEYANLHGINGIPF